MKVPAGTLGRGPRRARAQAGLRAIPAGPPCRLGERIARPPPANEPGLTMTLIPDNLTCHDDSSIMFGMGENLRLDIEKAYSMMQARMGAKHDARALPSHLMEDETVDRMALGQYGYRMALVVATDRRLLFFDSRAKSETTEDFPYNKISSIQWSSTTMSGIISVFASGNKTEIKLLNKNDGKAIVDLVRSRATGQAAMPQSQSQAPPASQPTAPDRNSPNSILDALKQLGELHAAGVITDEEFSVKKAQLLGRL